MTAPDPMPLVERLRDTSGRHINGLYDKEAADEIERLTAALEAEKAEVFRLRDALAQAKGVPEGCSYPSCVGEQPADGGCCRTPFTSQMSEAAERYLKSVGPNGYWLPAPFRWDDCYRAMLAATPPSPAQAAGWRDIESAPRETMILLACADWLHSKLRGEPCPIKVGAFSDGRWQVFGASWTPTHWQPLPAAPGHPPSERQGLTDAARDVLAERRRQVDVEGWTPEHDDQHYMGELVQAAAAYAVANPRLWPPQWDRSWWRPKGRRRDIVRAAALLLAEIERLDRAADQPPPAEKP